MSRLFTKHLALALLVIFMTNIAVWSVQPNWLAHELEHVGNLEPMTVAADHVDLFHTESKDSSDDNAPNAIEHQLLHAADHLQLLPSLGLNDIFLSPLRVEHCYFTHVIVLAATFEAPFRPPRSTSFLI